MSNIILVGVCDKPESTNVAQAKYFSLLGYNVIPINYRTILQYNSKEYFEILLKHAVTTHEPELVFFSKCNGIDSELIKWCSSRTKTWLWFMDYTHNVTDEIKQRVKYATFASATSTEVVNIFKEINKNTHWIIEGYDPHVMYKEALSKEYETIFIGNATQKRVDQLSYIKNNKRIKRDVTIFGSGWPSLFDAQQPVYGHEFRKTVCKAKFALNLVHGNIFSNRVVDSLACGTHVISEICDDILNVFPYEKEDYLSLATSALTYKINSETNIEKYTWENVLKKLMEIAHNG